MFVGQPDDGCLPTVPHHPSILSRRERVSRLRQGKFINILQDLGGIGIISAEQMIIDVHRLQPSRSLRSLERFNGMDVTCLLYTSPSPRDRQKSRMPSSA